MVEFLNSRSDFGSICKKISVSKGGVSILKDKSELLYFYLNSLRTPACNILKQDLLSIGADVAVSENTINCKEKFSDALIIVNKKQLKLIIKKLKAQPYGLKDVAKKLEEFVNIDDKFNPKIMGIINANDDSFFSRSRFVGSQAISKIEEMIVDGADIIDIGGVSSRPGSIYPGEEEEFERVKPIIDEIYRQDLYKKADFSLDSFSPKCVEYALERGFTIVNDITALESDAVAKISAKFGATIVLMHKKGSTENMQEKPHYENILLEVEEFFSQRIEKAKEFGIEKIVLDVGIGFGKRLEDNIELIKHLKHFKKFGYPLLVGASRKSMIDMIYSSNIDERLPGTLSLHQMALENGAEYIRVHDVKEHKQMVEILKAFRG